MSWKAAPQTRGAAHLRRRRRRHRPVFVMGKLCAQIEGRHPFRGPVPTTPLAEASASASNRGVPSANRRWACDGFRSFSLRSTACSAGRQARTGRLSGRGVPVVSTGNGRDIRPMSFDHIQRSLVMVAAQLPSRLCAEPSNIGTCLAATQPGGGFLAITISILNQRSFEW